MRSYFIKEVLEEEHAKNNFSVISTFELIITVMVEGLRVSSFCCCYYSAFELLVVR